MSVYATSWAYRQHINKPGAKFTLVALADYANEQGFCYPSQERLAAMTGQSVRTVRAHLKELERAGYIERGHRHVKGHRTSDGYHLLAPLEVLHPHYRQNSPVDYRRNSPVAKSAGDPLIDQDDPSECVAATRNARAPGKNQERPHQVGVNDPNLAHPAVCLFSESMGRTPNRAQCAEIAATVTDLDLFERVLRRLQLEELDKSRLTVSWALERYGNNGVRPVAGVVTAPTKSAAERSEEARRKYEQRGGNRASANA